jgi:receptor protein-tyrosine kinase
MTTINKLHLVERAAERLLRSGAAPDLAGTTPPAEGELPPGEPPASALVDGSPTPPAHPVITVSALGQCGLIESKTARNRVSEEFRLVQSQVLRAAFAQPGGEAGFTNLLMVTSARPKEGKSFTALNLAASIARRGDRQVLLVDADAKHGSLCDSLGLSQAPGLLDLALAPVLDPLPFLRPTEIAMLSFLPVGQHRGERPELFASDQMVRAMQSLGRRFADRLVVLDVSPCLSTSDPATLAPVVGQILFVIEAERTQRDEVEASLDLIQTCPTITLLLNKVRMSTPRTFGVYSYSYTS